MLDPPLKFAKNNVDENAGLVNMLAGWGVTADKDLVLDTSGVGQLFGMGPESAAGHQLRHAPDLSIREEDCAVGLPDCAFAHPQDRPKDHGGEAV